MKTRNVIAIAVAALVAGLVVGYAVSSVMWERFLERVIVSASLYNVTSACVPLEYLSEGQTNRAAVCLETDLSGALQAIAIQADKLQRPDLLTNTSVLRARQFQIGQADGQAETPEDTAPEPAP